MLNLGIREADGNSMQIPAVAPENTASPNLPGEVQTTLLAKANHMAKDEMSALLASIPQVNPPNLGNGLDVRV